MAKIINYARLNFVQLSTSMHLKPLVDTLKSQPPFLQNTKHHKNCCFWCWLGQLTKLVLLDDAVWFKFNKSFIPNENMGKFLWKEKIILKCRIFPKFIFSDFFSRILKSRIFKKLFWVSRIMVSTQIFLKIYS